MKKALPFLWMALLFMPGVPDHAGAQEGLKKIVLAGENNQSRTRLAAADRLVNPNHAPETVAGLGGNLIAGQPLSAVSFLGANWINEQKWDEAVEEFQRIIYDEGDNLVPAPDPPFYQGVTPRSLPVRQLCHLRIASAPPSVLQNYQKGVRDLAAKWLKEGKETRNPGPLRRLTADLFCSPQAGEALEFLGDLAFEKGEFAAAIQWWRLLALPVAEAKSRGGMVLLHPGPGIDRARVRAKQILALAFLGAKSLARMEWKEFQKTHPSDRGHLAGTTGNYAALLKGWLEHPRQLPEPEPGWFTFAGSSTRSQPLVEELHPRLWADGPAWQVPLENGKKDPAKMANDRTAEGSRLAFHPVIADDKVFLAGPDSVTAYHLLTGKLLFRYDLKKAGHDFGPEPAPLKHSIEPYQRFTLTVAGQRVYARLGAQGIGPKTTVKETSYLVCLEMEPAQGEDKKPAFREVWAVKPQPQKDEPVLFEGAPLVYDGRVYIALSRPSEKQNRIALACYDAARGEPLWLQEICVAGEFNDHPGPRFLHHLLTLAGNNLVYCSHAGAIVAVDRRTGRRMWGVRYSSRGLDLPGGGPSPRDLCPCLAFDNRVVAAPLDSDRLICLDATTGQTLWERDKIEVVHLLGVGQGNVIFTTPTAIRALDVVTGADVWIQPGIGKLPGFGRGLLIGGWVLWPTQDPRLPFRTLSQKDGDQELFDPDGGPGRSFDPTQLRRLQPGNLAFGNGCLVIAGVNELSAYIPPQRFLKKIQVGSKLAPDSLFQLARAEAGAGMFDQALKHFSRAIAGGEPGLKSRALHGKHEMLLDRAARLEAGDWATAAGYLDQAAAGEYPPALRLRAILRLAHLCDKAGRPERALKAWQTILEDDQLQDHPFLEEKLQPCRAGSLAVRGIQKLIAEHGPGIYEPLEKQARSLLVGNKVALLKRLVREYPHAGSAVTAWEKLFQLEAAANHPGAAAQTCRALLKKKDRVGDWVDLARAYEKQHCWEASRNIWIRLLNHKEDYRGRPVRDLAALVLKKEPYPVLDKETPPALSFPLEMAWETRSGDLLVPVRSPLAPRHRELLFIREKDGLVCRNLDGTVRWKTPLPFHPTWVGLHVDLVVAAGPGGIQALRRDDGRTVWSFGNPALSFSGRPGVIEDPSGFGRFQLTASNLLFFFDERRLLALDLETGQVSWSRLAPAALIQPLEGGGRFQPHFYAGDKWLVVQTNSSRRLTLDAATGHGLHDSASVQAWAHDPLPLAENRLCLGDNNRVILLDMKEGKEIWSFVPGRPTSLSGQPPRLAGDSRRLLVLVSRNYGWELVRLDPANGRALWSDDSLPVCREPIDPEALSFDDRAFYYVQENVVMSRSLANGKILWRKPLPYRAGLWRTRRINDALAVFPAEGLHPPWVWLPLGHFLLAVPAPRFPRDTGLTIHDARDGRIIQKIDLFLSTRRITVETCPGGLVVGAGNIVQAWKTGKGEKT